MANQLDLVTQAYVDSSMVESLVAYSKSSLPFFLVIHCNVIWGDSKLG